MAFSVFKPFASQAPDPAVESGRVLWDPALECPATSEAVGRWWWSSIIPVVAGLILYAIVGAHGDNGRISNWQILAAGLIVAGAVTGAIVLPAQRSLARNPWTEWQGMFVKPPAPIIGRPLLVLVGADGRTHVLATTTRTPVWESLAGAEGVVWFCGDPEGSGAVSLPGGEVPLPARQPWIRRKSKQAAAQAALAAARS